MSSERISSSGAPVGWREMEYVAQCRMSGRISGHPMHRRGTLGFRMKRHYRASLLVTFLALFAGFFACGSDARPSVSDLKGTQKDDAPTNHVQRRSPMSTQKAMDYLKRYNHMSELETESDLFNALTSFQSMANMNATGELDDETMAMMQQDRCGVRDNMGTGNRMRRYDAMNRWPKNEITWRVNSFDDLTPEQIISTMNKALGLWAEYSPLRFREVIDPDVSVDFNIEFKAGDHEEVPSDRLTFDGPGGVLAHAFFPGESAEQTPLQGDVHFDADESFTLNAEQGINLLQIAVHEFGHSLGIGHSDSMDAAMSPFYSGYNPNFNLHSDDIDGIRYMYGHDERGEISGRRDTDVTMRPNPDQPKCPNSGLDAIVATTEGIYAFKGKFVWKLDIKNGIERGWPKLIGDVFPEVPNDIDAGIFFQKQYHLFKGGHVYIYTETLSFYGNFSIKTKWRGVPDKIDAAFRWSGNGYYYFIKDDQYYKYNTGYKRVAGTYPSSLNKWHLKFDRVDAVLQYGQSPTYFFTGPHYYRYNDRHSGPEQGYPRRIDQWFGCAFSHFEQHGGAVASVVPSVTLLVLTLIRTLAVLF